MCDLNFKDFYKISILVCQYKPEIYQKNGAVSIITYEGVARNLQSQIPFLQFFLPNLKKNFNFVFLLDAVTTGPGSLKILAQYISILPTLQHQTPLY